MVQNRGWQTHPWVQSNCFVKFSWSTSLLFVYVLSMAAIALQWQVQLLQGHKDQNIYFLVLHRKLFSNYLATEKKYNGIHGCYIQICVFEDHRYMFLNICIFIFICIHLFQNPFILDILARYQKWWSILWFLWGLYGREGLFASLCFKNRTGWFKTKPKRRLLQHIRERIKMQL